MFVDSILIRVGFYSYWICTICATHPPGHFSKWFIIALKICLLLIFFGQKANVYLIRNETIYWHRFAWIKHVFDRVPKKILDKKHRYEIKISQLKNYSNIRLFPSVLILRILIFFSAPLINDYAKHIERGQK